MHSDKKYKKSKVTAPSQESALHIPPKAFKNILDFLPPIDGLKTVTISKATLTDFGSYIVQRLQNEKFKYKIIQSYFDHNLALYQDGSLYVWGGNDYAELGLGHDNSQYTPQSIDPKYFNNKTIQSIYGRYHYTLALMEDGSLYTWGYNVYGELGLGHNTNQNTPQLISPDHFENKIIQSIHTGNSNNLTLMNDGSLYSWGCNGQGQLGLGHYDHQNTPQKIEDRLEKAFRLGHKNLKSLSMFSDKSPEDQITLKHRLLSLHVPMANDMKEITEAYAQGSPSAGQT